MNPTPGPWMADSIPRVYSLGTKERVIVADCRNDDLPFAETIANANLQAAAWDLLIAGKDALKYMRRQKLADKSWADDLATAISKAEGRT